VCVCVCVCVCERERFKNLNKEATYARLGALLRYNGPQIQERYRRWPAVEELLMF
jgi:hypothetical protein